MSVVCSQLDAFHSIIRSFEPGEDWSWCYVDEVAFVYGYTRSGIFCVTPGVKGLRSSSTCERGARGGGDVGVRVGVTADPPAALRRLGQEHPGALA
jgi:hypothetical protein